MSNPSFHNNSSIFFNEIDYSKELKQYDSCYNTRLKTLKDLIVRRTSTKWGGNIEINKSIPECKDKEQSVIIGVIYKEMPLKPNPLLTGFSQSLIRESFVLNKNSKDDKHVKEVNKGNKLDALYLEDNEGKVLLDLSSLKNESFTIDSLYSGIVVGLKGSYNFIQGYFSVYDYVFPYEVTIERKEVPNRQTEGQVLILTSGLNLGFDNISKEKLGLIEYFKQKSYNNQVYKLVLIGGTFKFPNEIEEYSDDSEHNQVYNKNITFEYIKNVQSADNYLDLLSNSIDIEIIASDKEPTNFLYPQFPVNKNILMKCMKKNSLSTVSNPYFSIFNEAKSEINDQLKKKTKILYFSSQIINTIKKYTVLSNETKIISSLFEYGHFCPIVPDMLRSYPFKDIDPFIIEYTNPDVVIFGGCENFDQFDVVFNGQVKKIILVPLFLNKNSIVYYNVPNGYSYEVCI